ncbi:1-acyl-sn-glycerol-3-phosphate acyltransferase [bacterium]|nr:1-acyl-sn-glycerol-3-phosphate acyltransferase [bacterium]
MVLAATLTDRVYRVSRWLARNLLTPYWQPQLLGLEQFPSEGPVLLVVNHPTMLDAFTMLAVSPRRLWVMVGEAVLKIPLAGAWIRAIGIIPVRPGGDSLSVALETLQAGECVTIFPEGVHSNSQHLRAFRRGAAVLARTAGVPVVPVAIAGCAAFCGPLLNYVRGGSSRVAFGPPLYCQPDEEVTHFLSRLRAALQVQLDLPEPLPTARRGLHFRLCQLIWVPTTWLIFTALNRFRPGHRR